MGYSFTEKKRIRKSFAKQPTILNVPYLLAMQKASYNDFLQMNLNPLERDDSIGLQKVFKDVFPITSINENIRLDFIEYSLSSPYYDVHECLLRGVSYTGKLHARIKLTLFEKDSNSTKVIHSVEENVYMGEIPFITDNCSFIINGNERVVVSQLHRSPGVYFEHDNGKNNSTNKLLYSARIIPYRGSWLDLEFDAKDLMYFRIDNRRKMNVSLILKAIGYTRSEILDLFYDKELYTVKKVKDGYILHKNIVYDKLKDEISPIDIKDQDGKIIIEKGRKFNIKLIRNLEAAKIEKLDLPTTDLLGRILANDIIDTITGEVIVQSNTIISDSILKQIINSNIECISTLYINDLEHGAYLSNTLRDEENSKETAKNSIEAIHQIYKMMRPGEPYSEEIAEIVFNKTFFNADSYDLSEVGRFKFNSRTYENEYDNKTPNWMKGIINKTSEGTDKKSLVLSKEDLLITLAILIELRNGRGVIDDIDHLGNRRVRGVGELVENQFRIGLSRIDKALKERLSQTIEEKELMPNKLISAKPINLSLKDFFATSQLSQFMDQTNPLSEITHKRRISALGPGGLTRDRAGFEVRDVHVTHYGRVCPIETPEGQNIGLINSLSVYAQPNKYGFLETPYRKVENGIVTNKIDYLSAIEESKFIIAQANARLDNENKFIDEMIVGRQKSETTIVNSNSVQYMDVATNQVVSVAASLIPFLEHNDANRSLMGSNMQRQGVPCLKAEKPLVGTGIEREVAIDSGSVIIATRGGKVAYVDGDKIVIVVNESEVNEDSLAVDTYNLIKYVRSNQNTCLNQKPIVKNGDIVNKGDVIADSSSTDLGELAVGQNVLVAFMPWNGFNFEDSILISEKLVAADKYTSIHIEELVVMTRETKQGNEEITRDIPNLSQSQLSRLDEYGIVHIGATVNSGDVLVGKVTPKGETQLTSEEKLLRAVFGEKASEVKDTSLRLDRGVDGVVIDVKVFNRQDDKSDSKALANIESEINEYRLDLSEQLSIIEKEAFNVLYNLLLGQKFAEGKKQKITEAYLNAIEDKNKWFNLKIHDEKVAEKIKHLHEALVAKSEEFDNRLLIKREKLSKGIELPNGVIKMVKVFIAIKRRLQPGDKMAGRHGNKGVISKVLPVEDMPYMEDGRTVDVVLNPIGVPSRMNIGQILEVHLGLAAKGIGDKINQMIKDETKVKELKDFLDTVYNVSGKTENIKDLNDSEIMDLSRNLVDGLPFATPVFDGAQEIEIKKMLELADMPTSGQIQLYDGRTGEPFHRQVTVGYMYVLKLHHLVDQKLHARDIGPYSLVTQQPLGGKAQNGGQRFGEMEVWALEAYGAAYTLQEMLTVKSDDIEGRTTMYENILEGRHKITANVPEAFNVLTREVKALGLDIELLDD